MILSLLFYTLPFLFLIRVITNILYGIWLWQTKEYRWDRLLVHLRETKEGRDFLFNKKTILFNLLFLFIPFVNNPVVLSWYLIFVTTIFFWDVLGIFYRIHMRTLRRPVFSIKAIILLVITFGFVILFLLSIPLWPVMAMVFVDRLVFPLVSIFVLLVFIPTTLAKLLLMELARLKIAKMTNLTVVGVTGSYGKSSTKELIADFLSAKFNTLKTPGSVNTDLGIALFILKHLTADHEMFVVEVGAYKRGEIAAVCEMIKPNIGVLTGINEQHIALFGSIENTKKAKFELIESLPKDAMAFFNGEDETCRAMAKWSKVKKTYTYVINDLPKKVKKNPLFANIAGAYFVAIKLGISEKDLEKKLIAASSVMGIKRREKDSLLVLDDSFNTNPKGFELALDTLSKEKGKKILITPGIIELGTESKRIHTALGEKIGTICDVVILTTDNFREPLEAGIEKTQFARKKFFVPKREKLLSVVKKELHEKTVVLLEGRVPGEVKTFLLS